jgi:hypothetical protein
LTDAKGRLDAPVGQSEGRHDLPLTGAPDDFLLGVAIHSLWFLDRLKRSAASARLHLMHDMADIDRSRRDGTLSDARR